MAIPRRALWTSLLTIAGALPASGQSTLSGVVRDSAGAPISGAQVSIDALGRNTTTDSAGHYALISAANGLRLVQVRRVGFAAANRMVQVKEGATADFMLTRIMVTLDTVRRIEQYRATDLPMMEFLENRKMGLGHFLSRATMDSMRGRHLGEALCCIPGTIYLTSGPSAAYLAVSRIQSISNTCKVLEDGGSTSPIANARCVLCFPDVYMDFQLLSRMGEVPNLNRFTPETLEAVEVYDSPAQLPVRYMGSRSQCGAIVLHMRRNWP